MDREKQNFSIPANRDASRHKKGSNAKHLPSIIGSLWQVDKHLAQEIHALRVLTGSRLPLQANLQHYIVP